MLCLNQLRWKLLLASFGYFYLQSRSSVIFPKLMTTAEIGNIDQLVNHKLDLRLRSFFAVTNRYSDHITAAIPRPQNTWTAPRDGGSLQWPGEGTPPFTSQTMDSLESVPTLLLYLGEVMVIQVMSSNQMVEVEWRKCPFFEFPSPYESTFCFSQHWYVVGSLRSHASGFPFSPACWQHNIAALLNSSRPQGWWSIPALDFLAPFGP